MYLNFSVLWAFVGNGKLNLFLLMVFTAKQTTLILVLCKAAEEQVVFVSTSQPCNQLLLACLVYLGCKATRAFARQSYSAVLPVRTDGNRR